MAAEVERMMQDFLYTNQKLLPTVHVSEAAVHTASGADFKIEKEQGEHPCVFFHALEVCPRECTLFSVVHKDPRLFIH